MKLSDFLIDKGWTQVQLAEKVGCDPATVCRAVAEQGTISLGLALRFQAATDGAVRAEDLPISQRSREALLLVGAAA